MLESAYEACLVYELTTAALSVERQVPLPVVYEEVKLPVGYRMDVVIENCVVLEIKSVEALGPIHTAQLLSYLKLSGKPLGLLLNFNVVRMKDGIRRLVNGTGWQ